MINNIRKKKKIAIIGLGYVGLPLACLCAEKGYEVFGVDINQQTVDNINKGISHVPLEPKNLEKQIEQNKIKASVDFSIIKNTEIIIICVPTPIDKKYYPDFRPLELACKNITKYLRKGQLVILESTVNPGTIEEIVKPILEKSKLICSKDFYLAHCPERIDPGNKKWTIRNIPRVIGTATVNEAIMAKKFYQSILSAEVKIMKSVKEAEAVKIVENAFRDINIAFVNELAKSFNLMDIDTIDVISGASTKPFSFIPHWPGCGVGGHCIPVDPYYLIEKAKENGFSHDFLKLARKINNDMPQFTVDLTIRTLNKLDRPIKGTKIGILGLAYKKNISDTRESPAYKIIKLLEELEANTLIYDPYVLHDSNVKDLSEILNKSECLIIATDHDEFKNNLNVQKLKNFKGIKVIIDGKNCLDKQEFNKSSIIYKGIGR